MNSAVKISAARPALLLENLGRVPDQVETGLRTFFLVHKVSVRTLFKFQWCRARAFCPGSFAERSWVRQLDFVSLNQRFTEALPEPKHAPRAHAGVGALDAAENGPGKFDHAWCRAATTAVTQGGL